HLQAIHRYLTRAHGAESLTRHELDLAFPTRQPPNIGWLSARWPCIRHLCAAAIVRSTRLWWSPAAHLRLALNALARIRVELPLLDRAWVIGQRDSGGGSLLLRHHDPQYQIDQRANP